MNRIPREHNLTFVSVDQTLQNVALIVAPSIGGILAVTIGVRWGLVVAAVVGLVAVALFAADRRASGGPAPV
jgi:MFS family permease